MWLLLLWADVGKQTIINIRREKLKALKKKLRVDSDDFDRDYLIHYIWNIWEGISEFEETASTVLSFWVLLNKQEQYFWQAGPI